MSVKATNQCIRNILLRDSVTTSPAVFFWNNIFNNIQWKMVMVTVKKIFVN
uniref:Uncharacterized protein n=1 Tax=Anguilla anguilla TaxID=7936 RepID=A0A0E9RUP9_ANGAN